MHVYLCFCSTLDSKQVMNSDQHVSFKNDSFVNMPMGVLTMGVCDLSLHLRELCFLPFIKWHCFCQPLLKKQFVKGLLAWISALILKQLCLK